MIADYYFIATLLLGTAWIATVLLHNPAKRVLVVRTVFVTLFLLPIALLFPERQWISCDFFHESAQSRLFSSSEAKGEISPIPIDVKTSEISQRQPSQPQASARGDIALMSGSNHPGLTLGAGTYRPPVLLVGMFGVAVWQLLGFYRTRRLLRQSVAATGDFVTTCRVRVHPELVAPVIVGVFCPTILLPNTDDAEEIRFAIAHETAHFENGDLYGLAMERLLMFPLLFHPLFWLLRRTVRHDQETLADFRAVQQVDRLGYTEQLLVWARRVLNHPLPGGALVLGIAENQTFPPYPRSRNPFSRRIAMLLDETVTLKRPSRRWRWIAFGTLTAVSLLAATLTLGSISKPLSPEATLKEKLKELVPTPTEKAAISKLRQHVVAEYLGKPKEQPEAAPILEPNDEQISIECRILTISEPLAKVFLADKSLSWSGLPFHDFPSLSQVNVGPSTSVSISGNSYNGQENMKPGYAILSANVPMPLQVRFFEEAGAIKLLEIFQSSPMTNCLQAPKFTIFNGQTGSVSDVQSRPFVTGVLPVEGDDAIAYQPIIQIFDEGQRITFKATLLEDRSCRLDYCNAMFSKIENVEHVKLVDGEVEVKEIDNGKMQCSGVSIQSPNVRTLNLTIPPVTVPEGMSLLVAVPGMFRKESGDGLFLLVTPRRVEHEE